MTLLAQFGATRWSMISSCWFRLLIGLQVVQPPRWQHRQRRKLRLCHASARCCQVPTAVNKSTECGPIVDLHPHGELSPSRTKIVHSHDGVVEEAPCHPDGTLSFMKLRKQRRHLPNWLVVTTIRSFFHFVQGGMANHDAAAMMPSSSAMTQRWETLA